MRLVAGATPYKNVPGLTMAKVMGSGHGGGFSLRPSATHQGLICTFTQLDLALEFLQSPAVQAYRSRARECWAGVLSVQSARGHWDKQAWQASSAQAMGVHAQTPGPVAVLTRASIMPTKAMAFWRYAPAAQADLNQAPGCLLAMGLGEAPLVRQCTFSVWQDTAAMLQYAHQGAHQQASAAAYKHQFFFGVAVCAHASAADVWCLARPSFSPAAHRQFQDGCNTFAAGAGSCLSTRWSSWGRAWRA